MPQWAFGRSRRMIQADVLGCKLPLKTQQSTDRQLNSVTIYSLNEPEDSELHKPTGPILSLDLGSKRVGVAISDPTQVAITRIDGLVRSNWKRFLLDIRELIRRFDAKSMVIGFPLDLDGFEGEAAKAARDIATKFALSLDLPIFLQDERLSSHEAEERLRADGYQAGDIAAHLDSESAVVILRDFLVSRQRRILIKRPVEK